MYIGETKDLKNRIYQHKNNVHSTTFSARYNLNKLIYYEDYKTEVETKITKGRLRNGIELGRLN